VSLLLGAHISIGGGVSKAPERGASLGCNTIQIFLKNANQWKGKALTPDEIEEFKEKRKTLGIDPVIGHDSYLINLGSPDKELRCKSEEALIDEINRCILLNIQFFVMHPGAHLGSGEKEGLDRIKDSLNLVIQKTRSFKGTILLETTAGQGTQLGYRFEHLKTIIDGIEEKGRVGVCFDTCHVFAAGYDIREKDEMDRTFNAFDRIIGLSYLKLFHLNDSFRELGSRVDRHHHIGMGKIGIWAFSNIIKNPLFKEIPKIIETPKGSSFNDLWDRINLDRLRSLAH
jgi:deoxyribonuclease-4